MGDRPDPLSLTQAGPLFPVLPPWQHYLREFCFQFRLGKTLGGVGSGGTDMN